MAEKLRNTVSNKTAHCNKIMVGDTVSAPTYHIACQDWLQGPLSWAIFKGVHEGGCVMNHTRRCGATFHG